MRERIFRIASRLDHSKRYNKAKSFVSNLFNDPENTYKKYIDILIIFLIVSSVAILMYEVKNPVPAWLDAYDLYVVSLIFLLEYLLRVWVVNDMRKGIMDEHRVADYLGREFNPWNPLKKSLSEKFAYMMTPAAIIDLLAIFPAYRPLRVLRLFVLFRILKLLRYSKNIKQFMEVLANKKFELLTLLLLLVFVVITAGVALYVLEEQINPNINSLFDAIYWALVTISTVGYGDIAPVTHEGKVISMLIIVSGIAMISFATSVIVSAFSEKLSELKENRIVEQINKSERFLLVCGYGQLTKMFLRHEEGIEHHYIILDKDPEKVATAISDGYAAIEADASRHEILSKFAKDAAQITILCLTNSDIENIYITLNAKIVNPKIQVIARANDASLYKKFVRAGADHILMPNSVANTMLLAAISQPVMYKAVYAILTSQSIARIDEMTLYEDNGLIGRKVGDIDFKKIKLLLIGIQRGKESEFMLNPKKDEVFQEGDIVLVLGRKVSHSYFREIYQDQQI